MRQVTLYQCEYCGKVHTEAVKAQACEAKHYGLTLDEYELWKKLSHAAGRAGYAVGIRKNPKTEADFNEAIRVLATFESEHHISADCQKPTDFSF